MRGCLLLALLLPAVAFAKPRTKVKRPAQHRAPSTQTSLAQGPGQVTFVTATTAYLDRGIVDGLAVGRALTVTRAGRLIARCTIATVSEKWSTCSAQGMKIGDRLGVHRDLPPPPPAPDPVPDDDQLRLRRLRVEAEVLPLVDFAGGSGGLLGADRRLASVAVSHTSWLNFASTDGRFNVQRIDIGVYDVPIWRGLHGSAEVSVVNFSQRPVSFRAPSGSPAVLVRQLELSFHAPSAPLIARVGRTWTRHTPGLLGVDGAQAAWRNGDSSVEVGAYGGLLPEPVTLGVSTRRWAVGAFAMGRFEAGKGNSALLFQIEARVGYAVRALVPGRLEVAAAVNAWITQTFDAHLQVELGAIGATAPGFLDAVRLDFGWRPTESLRIFAGGRYQSAVASDPLEIGVALPGGQRAIRADAELRYELSTWLWIGASGGAASDFGSGLTQARFGPQLTLPQLVGGHAAFTLGYQEELGWLRGRTAWLQLTVTPVSRLRILARGSWFHQQLTIEDAGLAGHELSAALMVDLAITRWLWVRAMALGRGQPATIDPDRRSPIAGTVQGQIGGQL